MSSRLSYPPKYSFTETMDRYALVGSFKSKAIPLLRTITTTRRHMISLTTGTDRCFYRNSPNYYGQTVFDAYFFSVNHYAAGESPVCS